jgi:hypothetical protein
VSKPLSERMTEAAAVLDEVSAKYGYTFTGLAPWTAEELRRESVHVAAEEDK